MTNKYVDHYTEEDNEGNITSTSKELTLTSDGMIALTDDLELIIDKFTGTEEWQENKDYWHTRSEIRFDLMDLIHDIVNNKCDIEGYEVTYTGGDSALSPDDLEEQD